VITDKCTVRYVTLTVFLSTWSIIIVCAFMLVFLAFCNIVKELFVTDAGNTVRHAELFDIR